MMENERPSLETVRWRTRLFALFVALSAGILAFYPAMLLTEAALTAKVPRASALLFGTLGHLAFYPMLLILSIPNWGLPGLIANQLALRLRFGRAAFVIAFALAGLCGFFLMHYGNYIRESVNNPKYGVADAEFYAWLNFKSQMLTYAIPGLLSGAAAGIAAWMVQKKAARRLSHCPSAQE